MLALLCSVPTFTPTPFPTRHAAAVVLPPRSTPPAASIATDAITFSANPMSLTVVAFTVAWGSAPIIGATKLRESKFIQNGPKMPTTKREPPRLRGRALPKEALSITQTQFRRDYSLKELEVLWAALLKCYGSEALALQAVRDNPQMLNPSYSFCNTMLDSKRSLQKVMSEAEALEVMRQNPAVLSCGPSLEMLGAPEIQGFARARKFGNTLLPSQSRTAAVGVFVAAIATAIAFQGTDDPQLLAVLAVLRPALGTILASSFLFTAYAAAKSS